MRRLNHAACQHSNPADHRHISLSSTLIDRAKWHNRVRFKYNIPQPTHIYTGNRDTSLNLTFLLQNLEVVEAKTTGVVRWSTYRVVSIRYCRQSRWYWTAQARLPTFVNSWQPCFQVPIQRLALGPTCFPNKTRNALALRDCITTVCPCCCLLA